MIHEDEEVDEIVMARAIRNEACNVRIGDIAQAKMLRQARMAGSVELRCGMPPTPTGSCGPQEQYVMSEH
jgi:hypothetical protein